MPYIVKKRKQIAAVNLIVVFSAVFIIADFYFIQLPANADTKSYNISVKVTGTAECKENVMIELQGLHHALKETNKRGRVKFKNIPKGTYLLSPQKNNVGFSKESKKVYLKGRKKNKFVKFKALMQKKMPVPVPGNGEKQVKDENCTQKIKVYTSTIFPVLHFPGDYMNKKF